jgi:activating signal cointegrator complex subunit 3
MAELAILRVFNERPDGKIIYIAPMKALAKERIIDWKRRFQEGDLKKSVVELTGDFTPDLEALKKASLVITTPEKWDGISRNWQHREYVRQVALVIIDEIHLLGQERGPVIEVIVSRFRYITAQTKLNVRIVGLSTALANAKDVADWLGINKFGLYNFKPSVRPVPVEVYIEGFPEKHY